MRRARLLPLLLLSASSAALAAPADGPEVSHWATSIQVEFPEPMLTWQGARTAPITLSPAVPCTWYWQDDTTLECDTGVAGFPSALREATTYRIDIAPGLYTQAGAAVPASTHRVTVDPPTLALRVDAWRDGRPDLRVDSEQPLAVDAIVEVLHATLDGQPVRYRLEPAEKGPRFEYPDDDADAVSYRVVPLDWPTGPATLRFALRDGLRSPLGDARGRAWKKTFSVEIDPPFAVADVGCGPEGSYELRMRRGTGACLADSLVEVEFTRPLDAASLPLIAAALPPGLVLADEPLPARDANPWVVAPPRWPLRLRSTRVETTLVLALPPDLRAADGSRLGDVAPIPVTIQPWPSVFRVEPRIRVVLPGDVAPAPLQVRNPVAGEASTWAELQIAGRTRLVERTLRAKAPRNAFAPVPTPDPGRDLRREGGLAIGGVEGDYQAVRATAVAAFQLLLGESDDTLVAWATTWAGAQPVAGAGIELVDIDIEGGERIVARGTTGVDGVALIAMPAHAAAGNDATRAVLRVVRATAAAGRVVVPLQRWGATLAGGGRSAPPGGERWGSAADSLQFGVTERLLYRPGETVRYRLWPRGRDGNRLLAPPAGQARTVELRGGYDTVHLEHPGTVDAFGSLAGELVLPDTLPDDQYCLFANGDGVDEDAATTCFVVGRVLGQAVWASIDTASPVLLGGERLRLEIAGGYYSGGAAAEARLALAPLVTPIAFESAYPAWAHYTFIDTRAGDDLENDPLLGVQIPAQLDAAGKAVVERVLPAAMLSDTDSGGGEARELPLALMQFNARVRLDGSEEAASPTAKVLFAGHARYVGLRTAAWWLADEADPRLEAVVVNHRGEAVEEAAIDVRFETVPADDGTPPRVLARCTLRHGVEAACPFRAPSPGEYAIVAESPDAAPTRLHRWFGERPPQDEPSAEATLVALGEPAEGRVRVRLQQPFERATALVVAENGAILGHWLHAVGRDATFDVPVDAGWAPGVDLRVLVRPAADSAVDGLATKSATAALRVPLARAAATPVALHLDADTAAPGATVSIDLHNTATTPRLVVLTIVDDAVHQQAPWLHAQLDPSGDGFLRELESWTTTRWTGLLALESIPSPFAQRRIKRVEFERAQAVEAAPLGVDASSELDTIEVTGSRLARADVFMDIPAQARSVFDAGPRGGRPLARLRSHFPDAAYWNPGVELAPGEHRTLAVKLPDNLTRWRVIAWTTDATDQFAVEQRTLTTSLPVELRFGTPGRLFPGDVSAATVSARAAARAAAVTLHAAAEGAGVAATVDTTGEVAAQALLARALALRPTGEGVIELRARAAADSGSDAVAARVAVHSRLIPQSLVQTGWLEDAVHLSLPALPEGAIAPALHVAVANGGGAWRAGWIRALRDYPHRCWEQILSRGLGAALALADEAGREAWPEAEAVVDEAFVAAAGFQDYDGGYHFFPPQGYSETTPSPVLNAWTLRAYGLMARLGIAVPARLHGPVRESVAAWVDDLGLGEANADPDDLRRHREALAVAAAAFVADGAALDDEVLAALSSQWPELSWHARSELARAFAGTPGRDVDAATAIARLRDAGVPRGDRRVVGDARESAWAMGSSLRDQCAIVATLWELDTDPAHRGRRRELLRGLQDLYAGATEALDTQASVHCLLALRAVRVRMGAAAGDRSVVDAVLGTERARLVAAGDAGRADWRVPMTAPDGAAAPTARVLDLSPQDGADPTLHYVAELGYAIDGRDAAPTAIGMQLERAYSVLRDGRWLPAGPASVRAGDWVRVTLRLRVPAMRHFVAITDVVPGGWRTRDLALEGVGGARLRAVGDGGSWWFDTRRTGADDVRFYAERLPPGLHEVHYFAQAVQPGEYHAPPAVAELMYGRSSRATTAADTVRIGE